MYDVYMKTITLNVSEPVYYEFQELAKKQGRNTSEIIREAMELYRKNLQGRSGSILNIQPLLLGEIKQQLASEDDILGEMLK